MPESRTAKFLLMFLVFIVSSPLKSDSLRPDHFREANKISRTQEDRLAGLQPGKDTIETAHKRFGKDPGWQMDSNLVSWRDDCNNQGLFVSFESNGVIQTVRVGPPNGTLNADCNEKGY